MKKDVKVYAYETILHTNQKVGMKEIKKAGTDVILAEEIIQSAVQMGYSDADFRNGDGFHPNRQNGYLAPLLTYGIIFREQMSQMPVEMYDEVVYKEYV